MFSPVQMSGSATVGAGNGVILLSACSCKASLSLSRLEHMPGAYEGPPLLHLASFKSCGEPLVQHALYLRGDDGD